MFLKCYRIAVKGNSHLFSVCNYLCQIKTAETKYSRWNLFPTFLHKHSSWGKG